MLLILTDDQENLFIFKSIEIDTALLNPDAYPMPCLLLNPDQYRDPVAEFLVSDRGDKVDYGTSFSYRLASLCLERHDLTPKYLKFGFNFNLCD